MTIATIQYDDSIQDHRAIGNDLGLLQGGVVKGTINRNTSYFAGHELASLLAPLAGTHYVKKDTVSTGGKRDGGAYNRTTRRVIVRVNNSNNTLVENFALLWNHADGFYLLGAGFFTRALSMRDYAMSH